MKIAILAVLCLVAGAFSAPSVHVDPALLRTLKAQGSANIFISFREGTQKVLDTLATTKFATRDDKLNGVAFALRQHAQKVQQNVITHLNKVKATGVESFWVNNKIFVQNADTKLVESLAAFAEILEITEEQIVHLDPVLDAKYFSVREEPRIEWGVDMIQAQDAWNLDGGNNGAGIVVANIDTGVRYTHETLRHNFRADHGWRDPYQSTANPIDRNGHGTHTMGTIAGANGIGVAPGASWIACRGCDTSSCTEYALTTCGQFMQCPTLPNGSGADCTKAPHLVSNSWGGGQGQTFYREIIGSWAAAGIVPLFSNGNSGPYCRTANSPADDAKAIGVGSTTRSDGLSSFSSKGPSVLNSVKPDISAPGSDIYSAYHTSDSAYTSMSGTSMSCPHAAGAAALLLGRNENLSVSRVKHYLQFGNEQTGLIQTGYNCGGINENNFPNNAFGTGRINAFKALVELLANGGN